MTEQLDPEVVADLQLRASSQFDRSRGGVNYDWKKPEIIGQWACRSKCGRYCDVTEETMEALAMWNRELKRRLEAPIAIDSILFCNECLAEVRRTAPDRRRINVNRMEHVIRQLKTGAKVQISVRIGSAETFVDEPAAYKQLRSWGHPDVDGLRQALSEKQSQNKKPSRGGL